MTTQHYTVPKLTNVLLAGALWFVGIGVIGAVSAVSAPTSLLSSLAVMLFGIAGASILLASLRTLRHSDAVTNLDEAVEPVNTTRVNTHRRGASRAA